MSVDFQLLPHQGIRTLSPYKPGKSVRELEQEQGISNIIKLASNENPLGCSPSILQALADMSDTLIASYPAPLIHPLMHKLAKHLNIEPQQLIISNGSDQIFNFLLSGFALHTNKHLLTHQFAFSTYQIQAQTLGIPVKTVAIENNWQVDVNALIEACDEKTGLICLANPNNPTGTLISKEDILHLLDEINPRTLVVLDEAYFEYARNQQQYNAINWLEKYSNLVLTRTFSKAYGIAGLRLGYAIAHPSIIDILRRLQLPFAVNQAALIAGYVGLDDQGFIEKTLEINQLGMKQITEGLADLGLNFIPSVCNFITFDCKQDGLPVYQHLLNQGIIVRPLHPYNMDNYLRVSIGTPEQNSRFLEALRGVYS
ncbi:histidinol-phosphate transaminase [Legionella israelensis]|uniref:Histidinol-phosphate aminotransferase n=1 Tax=Legionella israelensis TaxID=454 RepID=A0A0W0VY47_9GAMM|nr:histidinol-phosphate transaminase [Legionella israelensis]KTD25051.1 histidinol-phosphate aminotransferase [Legionella israelensis]QBR84575.1 histidinol-phosphate transaminase [Legionella israelensis]QBS10617.1 histidinol-phosphate transaminase [Legionella israelensis]SCY18886.1 histidinol-phosphate aminotransferase [Legionella israelensis DSM 19235]STX57567.1 histidinol-phosphate aminotransferase [Legionella israelensis]